VAEQRHLNNAPIKEAVIEIRTIASDNFEITTFDSESSGFQLDGYSKKDILKSREFKFTLKDSDIENQPTEPQLLGYRYCSNDQKYVVNFQKTAFIFSRLQPYEDWDTFKNEAKKLWDIYVDHAKPLKATRVATRFINVINIPLPIRDFSDYLTTPPEIPKELPQSLASFMFRMVLPDNDAKYFATITQSLEHAESNFVPLLLDIDVYIQRQMDINKAIWEHLDNLRVFKNKIFFSTLQENTLSLFS